MKPLIETNPYLTNKAHRETSNARSAKTSCGVEGIKVESFSKVNVQIDSSKTNVVLNKMKSRLHRN
jgi:hypothetical protein